MAVIFPDDPTAVERINQGCRLVSYSELTRTEKLDLHTREVKRWSQRQNRISFDMVAYHQSRIDELRDQAVRGVAS